MRAHKELYSLNSPSRRFETRREFSGAHIALAEPTDNFLTSFWRTLSTERCGEHRIIDEVVSLGHRQTDDGDVEGKPSGAAVLMATLIAPSLGGVLDRIAGFESYNVRASVAEARSIDILLSRKDRELLINIPADPREATFALLYSSGESLAGMIDDLGSAISRFAK